MQYKLYLNSLNQILKWFDATGPLSGFIFPQRVHLIDTLHS